MKSRLLVSNYPRAAVACLTSIVLFLAAAVRVHALTGDQAALVSLANVAVTGRPGTDRGYVTGFSISGSYALLGWTDRRNSAGILVASSSGGWHTIKRGGGDATPSDLQAFGVDSTDAKFLVANQRPLPPPNGFSENASGHSTHMHYHERCVSNTTPPRTYNCGYQTPSTTAYYITRSIQPRDLSSAVTSNFTVSSGTAVISLQAPNGTVLRSVQLNPGESGGVGYYTPIAPAGVYKISVRGTAMATKDPGGTPLRVLKHTDTAWAGTVYW